MVRILSKNCSSQELWGVHGLQWSVFIKNSPKKELWYIGGCVMGVQGLHVWSNALLVWSESTDEILELKLLGTLILSMTERCQKIICCLICMQKKNNTV